MKIFSIIITGTVGMLLIGLYGVDLKDDFLISLAILLVSTVNFIEGLVEGE